MSSTPNMKPTNFNTYAQQAKVGGSLMNKDSYGSGNGYMGQQGGFDPRVVMEVKIYIERVHGLPEELRGALLQTIEPWVAPPQ